ncbi:MAG: PIN domain-containing protein [Ruminiclostridium sp.]|nr:PIN domain-containing protein [Ruminiclostridium sp.]
MAIRVFLDTNILFDIVDISRPNSDYVKKLFVMAEEKELSFFISALSINNIIYVLQNRFKMEAAYLKSKMKSLLQIVEVVPFDMEIIINAMYLEFDDIENLFQFVSALKCKSDYLVTEDKKFLKKKLSNDKIQVICTKEILNASSL